MTTPLDVPSVLGLSPWIRPLIAIAAKRKEDTATLDPHRILLAWWRSRDDAPADARACRQAASDERREACVEAVISSD
jgi:hypothetical protein